MKARICIALLALAASFNAAAQNAALDAMDPTDRCMQALAADPQFASIADKVALASLGNGRAERALPRVADAQERAALFVWQALRTECFEAGDPYRRRVLSPSAQALARSWFAFQQDAVADLQRGAMTYAAFNRRRFDLAAGLDAQL